MKAFFPISCILILSFTVLPAQVDTAWVRYYDGPSHSIDAIRYIALDGNGNIYVTGGSDGGASLSDFCTIKYSPDGDSLWVARFDGGNTDDLPYGFFVDNAGYVYVCGYGSIADTIGLQEFFLIKYDAGSGDTVWTARIPDMWCNDNGRLLNKLQVDNAGNVYVTGTCRDLNDTLKMNFCTIKFNSSGNILWTARYVGQANFYDKASSLTIDNAGNVYVTGASWSDTSIDFATVKYDPDGEQQWVAIYDGPAGNTDYPYAIAADNAGYVYVTGSCFVGGAVNTDFCTIKYDATTGDTVWVRRYGTPDSSSDVATMLSLDASGNIFVCGESYESGTGVDFCLIKYSPDGNEQWIARYSNGIADDYPRSMDFDADGNIYVIGESSGGYALVKFDISGQEVWNKNAQYARLRAIRVIARDIFYAAGKGNSDFVTIKFSPAARVAVSPTGFAFYVQNGGSDAAVLTISNIAVPGATELQWILADILYPRQSGSRAAVTQWKNSSSVNHHAVGDLVYELPYPQGTEELNGLAWGDNAIWATDMTNNQILKLDPVTGAVKFSFAIPGGFPCDLAHDRDYLWFFDYSANRILKYNPRNGDLLDSITNPAIGGEGMTTDGQYLYRGGGDSTIFRIDQSGVVVDTIPAPQGWCQSLAWNDTTIWYSSGIRLYQIDPDNGQILQQFIVPGDADAGITFDGKFLRFANNQDKTIYSVEIGYTGSDANWLDENLTGGSIPAGESIEVNITVTAAALDSGTYEAVLLLSSNDVDYPEIVIPVELNVDVPYQVEEPGMQLFPFWLRQNYPNPFTLETNIGFQIADCKRVKITIYNPLGRKVRTLVDKRMSPGYHVVKWDGVNDAGQPVASGVYLYRLIAGNRTEVRRMILLR